jgi:ABC-type oligopeptide transport system substrate-binding subunit
MMSSKKKAALVALVIAVLLAAAFLAASCGGSGTSSSGTSTQPNTKLTGNATVDTYLKELDQQMNSVSPGDFSDSELSNSALGQ